MKTKTLCIGFVGFGFIGKVHAHCYSDLRMFYNLPLDPRITHICTSRAESAEAGRDLVGAQVATTDFREVTESPDIDVVHICSPNHLHKDALLSAMKTGKHIYCDKPITATLAEAEEIRAALPSYKGISQMTFQVRFNAAVMRARQLISDGLLGEIMEFRAAFLHAGSADPEVPLKWKLSAEAGGGVIADLASHVLDALHYLLGEKLSSLCSASRIAYPQRPVPGDPKARATVEAEDCVMILARLAGGATGTIEATKIATGTEDELRIEIHGSKGAIRYNSMDPHHLEFYDATTPDKPVGGIRGWTRIDTGRRYPAPASGFPGAKLAMGWFEGHRACLANFLHAVAENRPAEPDLSQGIYVQELIERCRESANTNAWVDC